MKDPKPLSPLEQSLMDWIWTHGPATAEDARLALEPENALKDSTVRTILRRLEEKGYLAHETEGRTYRYRPIRARRQAAAAAVRRVLDGFCRGSAEELVAGMVENEVIEPDELRRLLDKLEAARDERKQGGRNDD